MTPNGLFDWGAWSAVEQEILRVKEEQRLAQTQPAMPYLCLHPDSAAFLYQVAVATAAKSIVEVGTNAGYSALWLARACASTGGRVLTVEKEPHFAEVARDYLARAGATDWVEVRVGDARSLLAEEKRTWDLAFLDAAKDEYVAYAQAVWPRLRVGGSLLADNVSSHADATRPYREYLLSLTDAHTITVPLGNGLAWTVKTGGASPSSPAGG